MNISLTNILISSLGLFILFKFVLSPYLSEIAKNDNTPYSFKKYLLRNIVGFFTLIFLLVSVSTCLSWFFVKWVNVKGGTTLIELQNSLSFVKKIESSASIFASNWAFSITNVLIVSLIILTYKNTKKKFNKRLQKALSKELKRLEKEYHKGKWKDLEPTEEMMGIIDILNEYSIKIQELKTNTESNEEFFKLGTLIKDYDKLTEYLHHLDLSRRINIELKTEKQHKPKTFKDRFLLLLTSKGLMNTFKKGSSTLFIICTLLLVPSLLSVVSQVVSQEAKSKVITLDTKLEQLELEIHTEKVEKEFNQLISQNNNHEIPLSEDDEVAIDELSNFFENYYTQTRITNQPIIKSINTKSVHSYSVKGAILDQFTSLDNNIKVNQQKFTPELVNEVVDLEKKSISTTQPATEFGKRIKNDLTSIALKNRRLWSHYKKLITDARKSFQVQATDRNIKGMLISNVMGHFAQGIEIKGSLGKLTGTLTNIPSDVAEQFYLNESKQYLISLAKAKHIEDVIREIGKIPQKPMPSEHLQDLKLLLKEIHKNGFSKTINLDNQLSISKQIEPHIEVESAERTIKEISRITKTYERSSSPIELSSYSDLFPGTEMETSKTNKKAISRSRNYSELHSFSKIGGVLIGKQPNENKIVNIVDINWNVKEDLFSISLTQKNGRVTKIADFDPEILLLALGYAADGRVTAVTILRSDFLGDQKVLLHPILIDTELGCQAIKFDKLIYDVIKSSRALESLINNERMDVNNAQILYRYTWAIKYIQIIDTGKFVTNEHTDIIEIVKDSIVTDKSKVTEILNGKNFNLDFLESKKTYFHSKITEIISRCIKEKAYSQCVKNSGSLNNFIKEKKWSFLPPSFNEVSGIRELDYALNRDLSYLIDKSKNYLWPFRFFVHYVPASTPHFTRYSDNYYDTDPWEFESLNKPLLDKLSQLSKEENSVRDVVEDLKQFVLLQRLFRLAMENKFDPSFPLSKLVRLAKETKPYFSGYNRTPRWLSNTSNTDDKIKNVDDKTVTQVTALKQQLRKELKVVNNKGQVKAGVERCEVL